LANINNILLVEDDEDLRENLALQLSLCGEFETTICVDGIGGLNAVKEDRFDLIILDVGLPDLDGREVCRMMRKKGVVEPIIMLTAETSEGDTILGLNSGANDYITKPFKFTVLEARIRAQLRHQATKDLFFTG
jgi:DNA-binding response OmpR family regulator